MEATRAESGEPVASDQLARRHSEAVREQFELKLGAAAIGAEIELADIAV